MWYPLLLLMACSTITENNGILQLLLCQPIQMIGVEVGKKRNTAVFIRSTINSKGCKLDSESTTQLLLGSAFAVLTIRGSHLEFIDDRRRNK